MLAGMRRSLQSFHILVDASGSSTATRTMSAMSRSAGSKSRSICVTSPGPPGRRLRHSASSLGDTTVTLASALRTVEDTAGGNLDSTDGEVRHQGGVMPPRLPCSWSVMTNLQLTSPPPTTRTVLLFDLPGDDQTSTALDFRKFPFPFCFNHDCFSDQGSMPWCSQKGLRRIPTSERFCLQHG